MVTRAEYFAPLGQRLDLALLEAQLVVVVGVGVVGSHIARALAQSAIGRLRLIDGDYLEVRNLHRHVLSSEHLISNKALAMADVLQSVPGLRVEPVPRYITPTMPDAEVDALLGDADLIVAATDKREVQRRISARARILDIPALFPGIYAEGGSEIFVQYTWRDRCYMCWDGWRSERERLREDGVSYDDALPLVPLAVQLTRGILDRSGQDAPLLDITEDLGGLPQLYVLNRFVLAIKDVPWRRHCAVCGGQSDDWGERLHSAVRRAVSLPNSVPAQGRMPEPRSTDFFDGASGLSGLIAIIAILAVAYGAFRLVLYIIGSFLRGLAS